MLVPYRANTTCAVASAATAFLWSSAQVDGRPAGAREGEFRHFLAFLEKSNWLGRLLMTYSPPLV